MNLLTDDWVPVAHQGQFKHISLMAVLCRDEDWQIACPRDDFELATLQLLICLYPFSPPCKKCEKCLV